MIKQMGSRLPDPSVELIAVEGMGFVRACSPTLVRISRVRTRDQGLRAELQGNGRDYIVIKGIYHSLCSLVYGMFVVLTFEG